MNQEEIKKEETLEQPTMGYFSRITGALFSPSKTFDYLNKRPDIWGATILIIIFTLCLMLVYIQKTDLETVTRIQLEQSGRLDDLSEEDADRAIEMGAKIGKYALIGGGLVGPIISFLIIAGVLHLIFILFKGETTFKRAFSVVTYSHLPGIFASIIGTILLLMREVNITPIEELVKSNLSIFLVQEEASKFLWNLASGVNFFTIWTLVLLIIGMATISKVKIKTSAIVICLLWVVTIVIFALLRGLGG